MLLWGRLSSLTRFLPLGAKSSTVSKPKRMSKPKTKRKRESHPAGKDCASLSRHEQRKLRRKEIAEAFQQVNPSMEAEGTCLSFEAQSLVKPRFDIRRAG